MTGIAWALHFHRHPDDHMTDSTKQIGFEHLGIAEVLSRHLLRVPPNQREYAWTEREVSVLLTDLAGAISANSSEYFLGNMVAIPTRPGELQIVDGQQRLATTVILLAAMRDYLEDKERIIVESINKFLTDIDRESRTRVSRLKLNVSDDSYFDSRVIQSNIDTQKSTKSHDLIDNAANLAAKHVRNVVSAFDEKDHGDLLNRWISYLEHHAMVILLKVPSDINAYKMFETLNDRGLRISQSDLVKNYLFSESGKRLDEAQHKWALMKGALESADEDDITITFLRHTLIAIQGYLREPDVYEAVQKQSKGHMAAIAFLSMLESAATDYVAIMNADHEKWNTFPATTRQAIRTLLLLKMRTLRPLTLAVTRVFAESEVDKSLRLLVSISVRYLIVGGARSGTFEQLVAKSARDISDKKLTTAKGLLHNISPVVPSDSIFLEAFKTATVSATYLARYYLRCLEMAQKGEKEPCFIPNEDQTVINLEHILPQKPLSNWPQFSAEQADANYKRIGNLALMQATQNSGTRSDSFADKKKYLAGSAYKLTSDVATFADWTPDAIAKRQESLANLALKAWPLSVK